MTSPSAGTVNFCDAGECPIGKVGRHLLNVKYSWTQGVIEYEDVYLANLVMTLELRAEKPTESSMGRGVYIVWLFLKDRRQIQVLTT